MSSASALPLSGPFVGLGGGGGGGHGGHLGGEALHLGLELVLEGGDAVVGGLDLAEDVLGVVVRLLEGLLGVAQPRVHLLCDLLNNQGIINCISYDYILYTG